MAPLLALLGGAAARAYGMLNTKISSLIDNFNRTTSGSLGTSSSGGLWNAIRGVWFANNTVGITNDSPSTYPVAGYNLGSADITLKLDTPSASSSNGGAGAAFWVTDSSNWWGVFPFVNTNTSYSQICSAYSQSAAAYTCLAYTTSYSSVCNGYTTSYSSVCNGYTTSYSSVWLRFSL